MAELDYQNFFISVLTERCTGKWAALTPTVEIRRLRGDATPFFVLMTVQFFRSEEEAQLCGIGLGKGWIDRHRASIEMERDS